MYLSDETIQTVLHTSDAPRKTEAFDGVLGSLIFTVFHLVAPFSSEGIPSFSCLSSCSAGLGVLPDDFQTNSDGSSLDRRFWISVKIASIYCGSKSTRLQIVRFSSVMYCGFHSLNKNLFSQIPFVQMIHRIKRSLKCNFY